MADLTYPYHIYKKVQLYRRWIVAGLTNFISVSDNFEDVMESQRVLTLPRNLRCFVLKLPSEYAINNLFYFGMKI